MKVLWSWLLEMCDLDNVPSVEEGASALTRLGIEIEGLTNLGGGFKGVVVAEVVGKRPHPNADKLTLVDVITERGGTATQVVCGAPNVPEPGRKVLWAQVGAELPTKDGGTFTLGLKPVKGVDSPGMLCADDELGLSDDHAGIVVLEEDDRTALGSPAQRRRRRRSRSTTGCSRSMRPRTAAICWATLVSRASWSRRCAASSCCPTPI